MSQPPVPTESCKTRRAERPMWDLFLPHAGRVFFFFLFANGNSSSANCTCLFLHFVWNTALCTLPGFAEDQMSSQCPSASLCPPWWHWWVSGGESAPICPICCFLVFTLCSGPRFVPLTSSFIASQGILNSSKTDGREFKNRWDEWVWEAERDEEKPDEVLVWEACFAGSWSRKNAFPPVAVCPSATG